MGSIVLVTVDVEPPAGDGPTQWRLHFENEAGDYLGPSGSIGVWWNADPGAWEGLLEGGRLDALLAGQPPVMRHTVAMGTLTVETKTIAVTVAAQGGNTFQTHMFSTVYTAFDVAVIRLVSIPGIRSVK